MSSIIPTPLPRIAAFERLGYGLFIHWGLYSQLGRGEWFQFMGKIPTEKYAELAASFTACDFDAPAIARLARESGMKYAVLTTRHHEGFSLYDTRGLDPFDAPHSPAGRDLVAEFVAACRAEGIVPFFYHTTLDWRWQSATCDQAKFEKYLDYLNASVEILCRNYGKIGGLWFDGNWSRPGDWKESRLYATIRQYQPDAIIVNNTGLGDQGKTGNPELDSVTFEQGLPTAPDRRGWPKYLAGEMCETLNNHWGIGKFDFNFKSPAELILHLCACRKTGANYLLNLGPTAQGGIPAYEAATMRKVGEWVALHRDALFDTRPVPAVYPTAPATSEGGSFSLVPPVEVVCQGQDFVLQNGTKFYYFAHTLRRKGDAHVVQAGGSNGPRTVDNFPAKVTRVRWMHGNEAGRFTQSADNSLFTLDCTGYDYGDDLVVRVAEILTA